MQKDNHTYRHLTSAEITQLERQGNYSADWMSVSVADGFDPDCLWHNIFEGDVCIGVLTPRKVSHGNITLPEGICNSLLSNTVVGNHPVIHNVRMLSGYTLGDNCMLVNISEMSCSAEPQCEWLEPMNENGGRRIMPFPGMTVGEAYLWARYRGRKTLMDKLEQFTRDYLATDEGRLGRVGDACVILHTQVIRNVAILSSSSDPTTIDTCLTLSDGVIGYGCTLSDGVIAKRFLLGEHVHLEFGLRLNDTVVGDNSTLARCEVGNSIIFPAHEQHHNNSFLIAALVMGQSNIAAGATIGSNHNSRTADNELAAGRGFWPGLCCSFKHSSRFASYCLLAKGDYPAELDISLPFALVSNNVAKDRLEIMPAYWWLYNMYAMDRNSRKFAQRDKRLYKAQHIEFDNLAPDTADEILRAINQLRAWRAASTGDTVYAQGQEKSRRPTVILKADEAIDAYQDMLIYYAMKTLGGTPVAPQAPFGAQPWLNIGGQLVTKSDMEQLIADIENGSLGDWKAVRARFDNLWAQYPALRQKHAYGVLSALSGHNELSPSDWQHFQQRYAAIQQYVEEQKLASRRKDETNPFRNMTYWDDDERAAVL